jgi:hypothetical protein
MGRLGRRLLAVGAVLLACSLLAATVSGGAATDSECAQEQPQAIAGSRTKVTVPAGVTFKHEIGRQRSGEDPEELTFETSDGAPLRERGHTLSGAAVGSFSAVEGEGDGRIPHRAISVGVTTEDASVIVNVCVKTDGLAAGRYAGKVVVHGDEIETFPVLVTATVQDSRWLLWLLLALGAGAVGWGLRTFANLGQIAESPQGRRRGTGKVTRAGWRRYRAHWSFWPSLFLSFVAAVGAWATVYEANATWGTHLSKDALALVAAAFSAAVGGTTIGDLLARVSRGPPGGGPPDDEGVPDDRRAPVGGVRV